MEGRKELIKKTMSKYILVDKTYFENKRVYQLDLYDTIQGVVKRVIVPVTEIINVSKLEDVENALLDIE